jgi:RimJ/RimL family protein N-acetyltransferase
MYSCVGRFCWLQELTTENESALFALMKDHADDYRQFVSEEPIPTTDNLFADKLALWFSSGRMWQFLIYRRRKNQVVGTIFFYHASIPTVKMSCFFVPTVRGTPCVGEAIGLGIEFARTVIGISEIHFSVYVENTHMKTLCRKIGAQIKGQRTSEINPNRQVIEYWLSLGALQRIADKLKALRNIHPR